MTVHGFSSKVWMTARAGVAMLALLGAPLAVSAAPVVSPIKGAVASPSQPPASVAKRDMAGGAASAVISRQDVHARLDDAASALRTGDYSRAVEVYQTVMNVADEKIRAAARLGLASALSQRGDEEQAVKALEGISADNSTNGQAVGELRGNLMLQLAEKSIMETGNSGRWLSDYARLIQQPNPERAERLRALEEPVTPGAEPQVFKVGVLLPLSGQMAPAGRELLRGMQLALEETPAWRGAEVELVPQDTESKGTEAATDAALQAGAKVLVGPMFSKNVTAAAGRAKAAGVPVLALSSDQAVAGENVHVVPPLPTAQARVAARWAWQAGKTKFAGLVPSSPYGFEVFEAFRSEVASLGGTMVKSSFFNPQNVDLSASVRQLVGNSPSGTVPFEVLFMPMPAASVPLATTQLAYYDVDRAGVQLLGTALWQSNSLLNPKLTGVKGSVFAAPANAEGVNDRYSRAYGDKPHGMAVQGYDIARLLQQVAAEHTWNHQEPAQLLLNSDGFYGSGGYLRFNANGLTERGLALVRIEDGQFHVILPALKLPPVPLPATVR